MAARGGGTAAAPAAAQEGKVLVAPGDTDRTCPACGGTGDDGDPRHTIVGVRIVSQLATLAGGRVITVEVPEDDSYHLDCHAGLGCDHCREVLEHNDGSVKGKAEELATPPQHVDPEPHEFVMGELGQFIRVRDREEALAVRIAEHQDGQPDGEAS